MRLKSHVRFGGGSEEKCQVSLGYEVTRLFPTLRAPYDGMSDCM
jgi:hypothetical protein